MDIVANLGLFAWAAFLLYKGLQTKDNWFGWLMFSRARYFQAELRDRQGPFDIWEYLPPCQVMLSERQIEALLGHIQSIRRSGTITGSVTLLTTTGKQFYAIRKTRLIPSERKE